MSDLERQRYRRLLRAPGVLVLAAQPSAPEVRLALTCHEHPLVMIIYAMIIGPRRPCHQ